MTVSEKDAQILQIIAKHCDEIIEISRLFGRSKNEFIENYAYQSSCSMLIQTIGEVVKKLSSDFLDRTPEIPWKNIKKMRNLFAHDYDHSIDFEVVWDTIEQNIPILREFCANILQENNYEIIRVKSLKFPRSSPI